MTIIHGCDYKCNDGRHNAKHENVVAHTQKSVFSSQYDALRIDILGKTSVQKLPVVHHFDHSIGVIAERHPVEIPEEKQVDIFGINILLRKCSVRDRRARGKD